MIEIDRIGLKTQETEFSQIANLLYVKQKVLSLKIHLLSLFFLASTRKTGTPHHASLSRSRTNFDGVLFFR